ncbi:MAG: transposase [Clostridia bacterium]|nr:transposase [Clostridia bacterium]
MSRNARDFSESGIYHIMFRGTNKQSIFLSDWDYMKMLELLQKLKGDFGFELYAYCLMSNHVHIVIKEKEQRDISKIMHRLLTKYSRWFNIKYERTGVLMENRYKSKAVEFDEYFLHLIRYIHQNPMKAGIVEKIRDYRWSSYNSYLSKFNDELTDVEFLNGILPASEFESFHNETEEDTFELFSSNLSKDIQLIYELKQAGVVSPERLTYLPDNEIKDVLEKLDSKFSNRQIVRVTGISDYRLRKLK